jgi:carbon storage regulator CsrA
MLVLSRKRSESIVIGRNEDVQRLLTVTVLEIRGKTVKLGFEANIAVPIRRSEVCERIRSRAQKDLQLRRLAVPVSQ